MTSNHSLRDKQVVVALVAIVLVEPAAALLPPQLDLLNGVLQHQPALCQQLLDARSHLRRVFHPAEVSLQHYDQPGQLGCPLGPEPMTVPNRDRPDQLSHYTESRVHTNCALGSPHSDVFLHLSHAEAPSFTQNVCFDVMPAGDLPKSLPLHARSRGLFHPNVITNHKLTFSCCVNLLQVNIKRDSPRVPEQDIRRDRVLIDIFARCNIISKCCLFWSDASSFRNLLDCPVISLYNPIAARGVSSSESKRYSSLISKLLHCC